MSERIFLGGVPVIGFGTRDAALAGVGQPAVAAAAVGISPLTEVLVASVVGAAASWAIEETVQSVRRRRRRRR